MAADLAIVGAGAIGGFLAGVAARAGHRVTLVVRRPAQRDRLRRDGVTVRMPGECWQVRPEAVLATDLAPGRRFDGVLLAVKMGATEEALCPLLAHLGETTPVLVCQNGLNDARVAANTGARRCVGVVLALPCVLESEVRVRCLVARPGVEIGPLHDVGAPAARLAAGFLGPPLAVRRVDNIFPARWSKLALNCATGPLLALTGTTLGRLCEHAGWRRIMAALVREVLATARLEGVVPAPVFGVPEAVWLAQTGSDGTASADGSSRVTASAVCPIEEAIAAAGRANPEARSSMSADLAVGRRSEIDWLNGAVVERAIRHGGSAPVNAAVWALVSCADRGDRPDPATVLDCLQRVAMEQEGKP